MAITDQIQSGVPNGSAFTRNRMQLAKPVQAMNAGSTAPSAPSISPIAPKPDASPISPQFNPVMPSPRIDQARIDSNNRRNALGAENIGPSSLAGPNASTSYGYPTNITDNQGETVYTNPMLQSQASPSVYDEVRAQIGRMSDDDILNLLNELASGRLKGTGPKMPAGMTQE